MNQNEIKNPVYIKHWKFLEVYVYIKERNWTELDAGGTLNYGSYELYKYLDPFGRRWDTASRPSASEG